MLAEDEWLYAGVDVGGVRKGFHVAVVDPQRLVARGHCPDVSTTVEWLASYRPVLTAVDAPIEVGPRSSERALARSVCHLYFTPARLEGEFYGWMRHGLELYAALAAAGVPTVECFPTATWTRLGGPRGSRRRREWSQETLSATGLRDLGGPLMQDERDAIAAALTARLASEGRVEHFGPIIVPLARSEVIVPIDSSRRSTPTAPRPVPRSGAPTTSSRSPRRPTRAH